MKRVILTSFIIHLFVLITQAQSFETLTYYQDDSTKLELDLFLPENSTAEKIPLVIFVHGGGFSGGNRGGGHSLGKFLAPKGYAVASITYTLYMKGKNFSCGGILTEKVKAIQIAANQLWLATGFFLDNAEKYKINPEDVFIAGSSAGAETVLHANYWDYNTMKMYDKPLPENFKYAGLISGAGAMMDINLITEESQIPSLFFHGNSDPVVPYGTAAHHYCETNASGWLMLFGSYSVYKRHVDLNGDVDLISYCGGKHEIAGKHFFQLQEPVYEFLEKVRNGIHFQTHTIYATENAAASPPEYSFCK
ncbi:hypothetical protein [Chondrinema litorale]|uniref:hypothetical protein n=1 Tax=Chondrinema litorale TaxID=2994555 RepID=UPI00254364B7|nr:hypothetical protein [Chondrinema litorale]UZR95245.1 hypothetical protein OQ292_05355 [Chondrinema litorale]